MDNEIEQIKKTISALEAQRLLLGDSVVDTALAPLREKLASLQTQPGTEQRKLVTVLFSDLAGFTSMSDKMDPEDVRAIMNAYFTRWSASIEKYGGVVEKYIGDAVMAVFGLSVAREDDPENAIRAALDMRQKLAELNEELKSARGPQLVMRTGIHTGLAMITLLSGETAQKEGQNFVAVGDTINLTSRLQAAAPEGGILISHDTYRLVHGDFDIQVQDPIQVKGKPEPVQVYLVLRARPQTFFSTSRGVEWVETRMIGREAELQILKDALSAITERRETQLVMVVGEAGIGKSRLIAEFDAWLERLPQEVLGFKCRASPLMESTPYSLFRDLISFRFQIKDSDQPHVVQAKIEAGIGEYGSLEIQKKALFIGYLLGFRFPDEPANVAGLQDPATVRDNALAYLIHYFTALATQKPVLLMMEDIHWADESSLELLTQLVERLPDQPLCLICTARPELFERRPGWAEKGGLGRITPSRIDLKPLTQPESQELIREIFQNLMEVSESLDKLITDSAEGNPFFLEEFIKMLIEERVILKENGNWTVDQTRLAKVKIPATLVEVMQARFDSLSLEERVLLQRASVVGRVFWDRAIDSMDAALEDQIRLLPEMDAVLRALSSRDMIFTMGSSGFESTREYTFKHALLRDVTYQNVLKRLRRIYHAYAATWLETVTQRSGRSGEYAAVIAEHYHLAEDHQKALAWYHDAGIRAAERYAVAEGIRCFSHCLELLPEEDLGGRYDLLLRRVRLYDTIADRASQKRDLEALETIAGQIQPQTTDQAQQGQPNKSYRGEIFLQWWHYYDALADYQSAVAAAQQAIAFARADGDIETEAGGYLLLGASAWKRSDMAAASTSLEKALSLTRQTRARRLEGDILRNLGITYQYQGDYAEARRHYESAQQIYQSTGDERGESMVLNSLGILLFEQGHLHEARAALEKSLEIKQKIGNRRAVNITLNNLGYVAAKMGRFDEAAKLHNQALTSAQEIGDSEAEADADAALGVVFIHLGDYPTAKDLLEKAMLICRQIEAQSNLCQIRVAQAQLADHLGDPASALQLSQEALELAENLRLKPERASATLSAGRALLAMGSSVKASERFEKAAQEWQALGELSRLAEARAACARACLETRRKETALQLVEQVLAAFTGQPGPDPQRIQELAFSSLEGMEEPFEALLNSYIVLHSAGDPRAEPLLNSAYRLLSEQASWIEAAGLRKSFLENISAHREIISRMKKKI